ncbi:MAG: alpha/beta hydrolase [Anaerolineae bacterium]|nr:alpha/beta hydrolase [Anaerolineae bacterium]
MRLIRLFSLLLVILGANFVSAEQATLPAASAAQDNDVVPRYEEAVCRFYVPSDVQVDCGYLMVPEDHQQPEGNIVRLHVAVFRSTSPAPEPDPIIYLEGGPGGSALETVGYAYDFLVEPFLPNRDFIVFDQRGTGYSQPYLGCPELFDVGYDTIDQFLLPSEDVSANLEAVFACHDRLVEQGINLSAFNSAQSAADVEALRQLLGYEQWNLFGISYGTRLALTVMRDYPEGVRSAILDSSYPLQVNLYIETPANMHRSMDTLFAGCANDPDCNSRYPNLEAVFFKLVDQLNREPVLVELDDYYHDDYKVLVTGDDFIGLLFRSFYSEMLIPTLPSVIYKARNGDYSELAWLRAQSVGGGGSNSMGMYYSVQCSEEVPFGSPDDVIAGANDHPQVQNFFTRSYYLGKAIFTVCKTWQPNGISPIENDPVVSDVPALILSGEYDPITPPTWGKMTGETLPNSHYYLFPGMGHGVSVAADCPASIMMEFLDDPLHEPDASCIERMSGPRFE